MVTAVKQAITVQAPNIQHVTIGIQGISPLVVGRFSEKSKEALKAKHVEGPTAKGKKNREPKDFEAMYNGYRHISQEGWDGIPATAIKAAMVAACRTIDYQMTRAKLAFFVEPDGFEVHDRTPLIKILKGKPQPLETYVKIQQTIDIIRRPMWEAGWEADVTISFDADMLSQQDIANLLYRAGNQVGICCGRPGSTNSVGQGWGRFALKGGE